MGEMTRGGGTEGRERVEEWTAPGRVDAGDRRRRRWSGGGHGPTKTTG